MGKLEGPAIFTNYESPVQPLTLFQQRLPTDDGQLWIALPAGLGDSLWHIGKLWSLCQKRDVVFLLPEAEQKRAGELFQMAGLRFCYMPGLTTAWVWGRPGSPPIPDAGAVISVAVNRHLEHGHRIEKFYPELPYRNPVEFLNNSTVNYKQAAGNPKYVIGFMGAQNYMEYGGNLKPAQWARIWRQVEKDVAPVALIGAAKDVEFAEEVMKHFDPSILPIFNASLGVVMSAIAGAQMCIGAHAGPMILSTYMGIPTIQAMPRWLFPMLGTWEMDDAIWGGCFLDDLENFVKEGIRFDGKKDALKMREASEMVLKVYGNEDPKWKKNGAEPSTTTAVSQNTDAENVAVVSSFARGM